MSRFGMVRNASFIAVPAIACILQACAEPPPPALPPPTMALPLAAAPAPIATDEAAPDDVLGPRPHVKETAVWKPPPPRALAGPNGLAIWLVERHELPLVAATIVVPHGSTQDPAGKGGTASFAANMLDEGAGKRSSLEIARAIDLLGADLGSSAAQDYSTVSLKTLKKNLDPALAIFADVVTKPTFSDVEGKRIHDLWENDLKARASDPNAVASIVQARVLFGTANPYGHAVDGSPKSAKTVTLADAKAFYTAMYRPDQATLVLVGDLSETEAQDLAKKYFGAWKAPSTPAPAVITPPAPTTTTATSGKMRVVLVDRADAPQSVISVVKLGVAMSSPDYPPLGRVNSALGGSFTSRLNQDLREDHGWTYGAKSRFSSTRGVGMFVASAAVVTDKTADALKALVADVDLYANDGPTREEADKTRLLMRAELVESYEGVQGTAARLARQAALGLGPDYDDKASVTRDTAGRSTLAELAHKYVGAPGVIVIVGPRAKIEPSLVAAGFSGFESASAEEE